MSYKDCFSVLFCFLINMAVPSWSHFALFIQSFRQSTDINRKPTMGFQRICKLVFHLTKSGFTEVRVEEKQKASWTLAPLVKAKVPFVFLHHPCFPHSNRPLLLGSMKEKNCAKGYLSFSRELPAGEGIPPPSSLLSGIYLPSLWL